MKQKIIMLKYSNRSNHLNRFIRASKFIIFSVMLCGCKKFVQIDPPITGISGTTVYSNNTTAAAAVTSIYDLMASGSGFSTGNQSFSLLEGLSADELTNYANYTPYSDFYANALNSRAESQIFWPEIYRYIHIANTAIEGLNTSNGITPALKLQLIGEAEFMRAFLHFYAVNLYGDVPLITSSDFKVNNVMGRAPKLQVYQQIIKDLLDAQTKLSDNYVGPTGNATISKFRPNKGTATALLARVYLYLGDLTKDAANYKNAEDQATRVIDNTANYSLATDLNSIFLTTSTEAIWQLQPINDPYDTFDGYQFVLVSSPGGDQSYPLSTNLVNAFEVGDTRFTKWVGKYSPNNVTFYYFPYKYKINVYSGGAPKTECVTVFRLAEQYLIRAEARAEQGNISGSKADLNIIRNRAGLNNTGASDQASLLTAILHERQVEFFTEWGHRWFDLKRTGTANAVMSVITPKKGGIWNPDWQLAPIPLPDLQIDHNLIQNPGY